MVLFDHVGLTTVGGEQRLRREDKRPTPPIGPSRPHVDPLTHKIEFFWAMSTMAAQHYGRHDAEVSQQMLELVARTFDEIAEMAGIDSGSLASPYGFGDASTPGRMRFLVYYGVLRREWQAGTDYQ